MTVEVKGLAKPVTSCTTPITNGMEVTTDTETVQKMRKTVVELLLSDHPLECPTCDKGGECALQDLTHEYGIKENRFQGEKRNIPVEEANNFIRRDYQRCILCTRYTRMCDEVQGGGFISVARRGFHAKIATPGEKPLDCEFCGQCVEACPVGALTDKMSKFVGRPWEMKKVETTCTYCMIFYGLGVTEHVSGTKNVQALSNLVLLCGHVGRHSSGLNALRGQNNVQGAGDMGAAPDSFPGYQKVVNEETRKKFEKAWGVTIPTETGLKSIEMIDEMVAGNFKALYVLGEDPAHTDPNVHHVREGLKKLDFLVVQELFHTETTKFAHVVLPAASFAECDGTFTNGERRVQRVRKAVEPLGGKANWQIICELATKMGYPMSYGHASEIWDEMASLSPMFAGINYNRIDKVGLHWPCPSVDHPGTPVMHIGRFATPNGLGKFVPLEHVPSNELISDEFPLILTTVRQRQHYNNGSMTRRSRPIHNRWPEELIWISPMDAEELGIKNFDPIRVSSKRGNVTAKAKVTDGCQRGIVSMTFHFAEANGNILTNNAGDPITKTPEYKSCAVRVEKANGND